MCIALRSQARRRRQPQVRQTSVESSNLEKPDNPPIVAMADNRTMAQLLEAPTEGYEDAIVIPEITANNFEIKHGLLNLVQNKQFFGNDKEDPHAHIRYFNKITSTMEDSNVTKFVGFVKLMLFPFSLEGAARIWLEKEPPRSIETWDDLGMPTSWFFRIASGLDDPFYNCPKFKISRFIELTAVPSTQASHLCAELKDMVRALIQDRKNQTPASAPVKAVEQSCVTCGGGHSYQNCPATNSNIYHDNIQEYVSQAAAANFNQANSGYRPPMVSNQIRPPGFPPIQNPHANNQNNFNRGNNFNQNRGTISNQDFERYVTANDAVLRNMQNQGQNLQSQMANLTDMLSKFVTANTASTSGSGTLPGNTVTNPKEDLKGEITLRVGKEAITFNLDQTSRYTADYNHMTVNKIDVIDMACDEYSQEVLGFSNVIASGNPTPYFEPIVSTASPTLTPFGDSDFLLFEEADSFLALEDDPTSSEVDPTYQDPEGDILLLEAILNTKTVESSVDEPPEVELKELPPHLEYAFLEGDDKLPVIIAKDLKDEEKAALLKVLKSHKRAIAWKLSDIKGVNPECVLTKSNGRGIRTIRQSPWVSRSRDGECMMAIFHDMIEKTMESIMDDFSLHGTLFSTCLSHLEKMLKRCEDTNLSLNWEKSHFMVKEGIVLGHKISKSGLEVDRAKVEDFSKIARPMTHLLEKETPFFFSEECIESFNTLKRKLTEAPILIAPDWDLPFELMCDASDFAIGAVLGQRKNKHFQPIHYASKTMNEAQTHYTTTEKTYLP
ncbi:reverse transcriptase domain-containing protein [Tanacetum coccineum]